MPDSGSQLGGTSHTLRWSVIAVKLAGRGRKAGWCRGRTSDKNTSKCMSKHHFLRSCKKFKKIWETFLQE
jgi:hypothetical protein